MQINEALRDLFSNATKPLSIGIDGPAGSGKSTLASEISRAFAGTYKTLIIHLDELYNGWDDPLSVELFTKIDALLRAQVARESIELPIFNWESNSFTSTREVKAVELLIIEGVGSLNQLSRSNFTTSIWLDIDQTTGLDRVLTRDGESIRSEMIKWQKMESGHFTRDLTRESADFILSTQ